MRKENQCGLSPLDESCWSRNPGRGFRTHNQVKAGGIKECGWFWCQGDSREVDWLAAKQTVLLGFIYSNLSLRPASPNSPAQNITSQTVRHIGPGSNTTVQPNFSHWVAMRNCCVQVLPGHVAVLRAQKSSERNEMKRRFKQPVSPRNHPTQNMIHSPTSSVEQLEAFGPLELCWSVLCPSPIHKIYTDRPLLIQFQLI